MFKKNYLSNIIPLFIGLGFILFFASSKTFDDEITIGEMISGITLGAFFFVAGILFLLFNFKAYITIEDGHIKGKFNFFKHIDCDVSDVDFVFYNANSLTIQLKSGKCYTICGIVNSIALCDVIKQSMVFNTDETPQKLIQSLTELKLSWKKNIICTCFFGVLMFVNIFITVILTDEREIYEFNKTDQIIMLIMCAIEILTIFLAFYFARKVGKQRIYISKLDYSIRRTTIEKTPLTPGNALKVLTDSDYSYRLTIFGLPNEDAVYFTLEIIDSDFALNLERKSELFENIDKLPESINILHDITDLFINEKLQKKTV